MLTDLQKKKIIADYLELGTYNATAKANKVAADTVKRIVKQNDEIVEKLNRKKEENTSDILAYMEEKKKIVCDILDKGLEALNTPGKLQNAAPAQITTAIGTLIDKWTALGNGPADVNYEDDLSRSLRELSEGLNSDE